MKHEKTNNSERFYCQICALWREEERRRKQQDSLFGAKGGKGKHIARAANPSGLPFLPPVHHLR